MAERASGSARGRRCFTLDAPSVLARAAALEAEAASIPAGSGGGGGGGGGGEGASPLSGRGGSLAALAAAAGPGVGLGPRLGAVAVARADQRDIAFAAQQALEDGAVDVLAAALRHRAGEVAAAAKRAGGPGGGLAAAAAAMGYDGIVLTGGCALNVRANSAVAAAFPDLPVHVPAAPSDCGLGVGAAWILTPPLGTGPSSPTPVAAEQTAPEAAAARRPFHLQFKGPGLFDVADPFNDTAAAALTAGVHVGMDASGRVAFRRAGATDAGGSDGGDRACDRVSLEAVAKALGARRLFHTFGPRRSSALAAEAEAAVDVDGGDIGGVDGYDNAAGFAVLAALLADENVIGVVRGRAEHGPRALGHRSLLSVPGPGMRERMNALKHREWYRPVAPVLAEEEGDRCFARDSPDHPLRSPFMSFAPRVRPAAALALPAMAHVDGTARPQTVSRGSDPWLHALLMAVKLATSSAAPAAATGVATTGVLTTKGGGRGVNRGGGGGGGSSGGDGGGAPGNGEGYAVLINTSFNVRGLPILNTLREALTLLRTSAELDLVLVEDWLFPKEALLSLKPLA